MRIPIIGLNILSDKSLTAKIEEKTKLIQEEANEKTVLTRKLCVEQIISYAKLDIKLKEKMRLLCPKCSKVMSS